MSPTGYLRAQLVRCHLNDHHKARRPRHFERVVMEHQRVDRLVVDLLQLLVDRAAERVRLESLPERIRVEYAARFLAPFSRE